MVILYTSNTGYTEQYAKLLGKVLDLPAYELDSAPGCHLGGDVIYLGWVLAGGVVGYKKAAKHYRVRCVCGVGMGPARPELAEGLRKKLKVPFGTGVFYLQGGFDLQKLKGPYKLIMKLKCKEIAGRLQYRAELSPEEAMTLRMAQEGGSCVSEANLAEIVAWYR